MAAATLPLVIDPVVSTFSIDVVDGNRLKVAIAKIDELESDQIILVQARQWTQYRAHVNGNPRPGQGLFIRGVL